MGSVGRLVAGVVLVAACSSGGGSSGPLVVRSAADLGGALGKTVRVTGTAYREKLGDAVEQGDLRVICLDPRFPADRLGQPVTVEGVLELTSHEAEVSASGEISQGTEAGVKLYTIASCKLTE